MIRKFLASPYVVMAVVLAMYLLKVTAKLSIGQMVNSPMITGDGWHNVADIFEACIVIATIWFSRLPASDTYPLGRRNIESLFSVVVGVFLVVMAGKIMVTSVLCLVSVLQGKPAELLMGPHLAPWVMGVTGGSALLSLLVSRYQIRVGKKSGHEALVADGQETASDGRIELATFVGVLGQYIFGAPWLEYPFALLVAFLMVHTGWEIFSRGMGALLQRTIGLRHEAAIKNIVQAMYGVTDVAQIKSFRTGNKVILILKVISISHTQPRVARLMKEAMASHIADYLRSQGFDDGEFFIRFDSPQNGFHRRAILLSYEGGHARIANSITTASHVAICDIEHGHLTRATEHRIPNAGPIWSKDLFFAFLDRKRVDQVIVHDSTTSGVIGPVQGLKRRADLVSGPSDEPSVYGL